MNHGIIGDITTPYYIIEEDKLRANLSLISSVAHEADVDIILALKSFALWKTFPIFKEYITGTTASSLSEAIMAEPSFCGNIHTYSPAYTSFEIAELSRVSSHLTFNSLSQYEAFHEEALKHNVNISLGLRINPEYSEVGTDLYNPCAPGTRFGVTADKLPEVLPSDIKGLHCHCHCESGSDVFARTLVHIEEKFSHWFSQVKWINFGGGHLMTRKDYDVPLLIKTLHSFHSRYPNLRIILEPGSAFAWQTGELVAEVVDIVEDHDIKTAVLNVSFTCHMPDCLEMPYHPQVRGAQTLVEGEDLFSVTDDCTYRLGGNSCLSGDFMGYWRFPEPLKIGQTIIFEDMVHYTTVKTCMFNGITHPAIAMLHSEGEIEILRQFTPGDYINRMD